MPKPPKTIQYKEVILCPRLSDPCHICISHKPNSGGYIPYRADNKKVLYHRYVYEQKYGTIPKGFQIRHKCDQPSCINLNHLELGTPTENAQDKVSRGRWSGNVKIKEKDLEIINNFNHSPKILARKLKVSISTIHRHRSKIKKKGLINFDKTIKMFNEILENPSFKKNDTDILSIKNSIMQKISECLQDLQNYDKDYVNETNRK